MLTLRHSSAAVATQRHTLTDWIMRATSTLVRPFTDDPLTPTISSPDARVPSLADGVLSKICTMYRQGQYGAPPPILIPIRFWESLTRVTLPDVTIIPLYIYTTCSSISRTIANPPSVCSFACLPLEPSSLSQTCFLPAPRYASAVFAVTACSYVRPSVTSRHCTKTAKRSITQTTPHDIPQRERRMHNGWVKMVFFKPVERSRAHMPYRWKRVSFRHGRPRSWRCAGGGIRGAINNSGGGR